MAGVCSTNTGQDSTDTPQDEESGSGKRGGGESFGNGRKVSGGIVYYYMGLRASACVESLSLWDGFS